MALSCVLMTANICITNQAYRDITRIVFHIQMMLAVLLETPATKKTIEATTRTVDFDSKTSDLTTQP